MHRPSLAIIGTGISGLSAGFFLNRHFDLTVFEADDRVGGHTHTVPVDLDRMARVALPSLGSERLEFDRSVLPIDTGFIVFNDRTYPNMIRLFEYLGVASQATDMSFSVRCDQTGIEYSGSTLNSYFAQRRNVFRPSFYQFLLDFRRFAHQATELLKTPDETQTVGDFFRLNRYGEAFYRRYFLPMGSAIWSCPQGTFESFPIRFICQFYHHHGLLTIRNRPQWRVVRGGSAQYLGPLTRDFRDRIRLNSPVTAVRRIESGVADRGRWEVHVDASRNGDSQSASGQVFDHVVLACHADQAKRILKPAVDSPLATILSAFPYQENIATLHIDETVLPKSKRAWAAWNYHLPKPAPSNPRPARSGQAAASSWDDSNHATVTYNMNCLQGYTAQQTRGRTFCVTLNGEPRIDSRQVIAQIPYAHPVFSVGRLTAQESHDRWIDADGLSLCGAYWGSGFHEDGLNSALRVSQKLLGMDPWKVACTVDGSNTGGSNR